MKKLSISDVDWLNFCVMVKAVRDARRSENHKVRAYLPRPYPRKTMHTMGAYQVPRGYGYRHKSEIPPSVPIFIERNGKMTSGDSWMSWL